MKLLTYNLDELREAVLARGGWANEDGEIGIAGEFEVSDNLIVLENNCAIMMADGKFVNVEKLLDGGR